MENLMALQSKEALEQVKEQILDALHKDKAVSPETVHATLTDVLSKYKHLGSVENLNCRPMKWTDMGLSKFGIFRNWLVQKIFKTTVVDADNYRWYHTVLGFKIRSRAHLATDFKVLYKTPTIPPADQDYQDSLLEKWYAEMQKRIEESIILKVQGELPTPEGKLFAEFDFVPVVSVEQVDLKFSVDKDTV